MPRIYHTTTIKSARSILNGGFISNKKGDFGPHCTWFYNEHVGLADLYKPADVVAIMAFEWDGNQHNIDSGDNKILYLPNNLYILNGNYVQSAMIVANTHLDLVFHGISIGFKEGMDPWRELALDRDLPVNRVIIEQDVKKLEGFANRNDAIEFFTQMIGANIQVN